MNKLEISIPNLKISADILHLPSEKKTVDWVAGEVPVALVYNGISHAVMMCTPEKLEEFAIGFSVSEGIVPDPSHIYDITVEPECREGIVVNIEIAPKYFVELKNRRRSMTGRTGCGICGIENLDKIHQKFAKLPFTTKFDLEYYDVGFKKLKETRIIGSKTGSTHCVAALDQNGGFLGGAEDIGRHVAMDKAVGMMLKQKWHHPTFFISSRASYEMVQKAAICGIEIVFAVSAPTYRAIELAKESNVTLVAFCRANKANVYSWPERLINIEKMKVTQ